MFYLLLMKKSLLLIDYDLNVHMHRPWIKNFFINLNKNIRKKFGSWNQKRSINKWSENWIISLYLHLELFCLLNYSNLYFCSYHLSSYQQIKYKKKEENRYFLFQVFKLIMRKKKWWHRLADNNLYVCAFMIERSYVERWFFFIL